MRWYLGVLAGVISLDIWNSMRTNGYSYLCCILVIFCILIVSIALDLYLEEKEKRKWQSNDR